MFKELDIKFIVLMLAFYFIMCYSSAQPSLPSHTISVIPTQSLCFGTVCLTDMNASGGTVTVDYQGIRTASGSVLLLQMAPTAHPAIFEIKLCQGRNVIMTYLPTITLTSNTGGSLALNLGPTEFGTSGDSFPVGGDCNFITTLRMGGTLEISSYGVNPEGEYSGDFEITFNYE